MSRAPTDRANGVEQTFAINIAERYLLQVVSLHEIVACKQLWLHSTAIAIDFHLINICETSLTNDFIGKLVDTS